MEHSKARKILLNPENNHEQLTQFFKYSVQDVVVLEDLCDKSGVVKLMTEMAKMFGCSFAQMVVNTQTSNILRHIQTLAIKKGILLRQRHKESAEMAKYQGAYNFCTDLDKSHQFVTIADVVSAYPSIVKAFNISPETYAGYTED